MEPHLPIWEHCLEPAALTDIGLRRPNNQDSMAVVLAGSQEQFELRGHLFMVADGMGAHAAGELASKLATDVIPLTYHKLNDRPPPEALQAAILAANAQIHSRGMASDDFRGMGTTVSTLVLLPQGALAAHVGDSRIYRLRGRRLDQLTFDHSLVWELRVAGQIPAEEVPNYIPKNIITRSLGPHAEVPIDLEGIYPIQAGDTFLLCSDGLSGQVQDDEFGQILATLPPQEAVRALVDLANLRGGPDNITVIVVRVTGPQVARGATPQADSPDHVPVRRPVSSWVISAIGILALASAAFAAIDQKLAAVASLIGVAAAGGIALVERYGGGWSSRAREPRLGKGPYTSRQCAVNEAFVTRLAGVIEELREAAVGTDWTIGWSTFNDHDSRAVAATRAADYAEAIRQYCHAISFMMAELRSQREHRRVGEGGPAEAGEG